MIADERDVIARLYDVADEHDAQILDELLCRAGLRWICEAKPEHPHSWTNATGEPCERCGRDQTNAEAYDAEHQEETV